MLVQNIAVLYPYLCHLLRGIYSLLSIKYISAGPRPEYIVCQT